MSVFQQGQRVYHTTLCAYAILVNRTAATARTWYVNREGAQSDPRGYTNTWNEHYMRAATKDHGAPAQSPKVAEDAAATHFGVIGHPSALDVQIGGDHYKSMKIQPIEYAMANKLNPCEFNVVKYVSRHRNKNGVQDLVKAKHMIDVLIALEYPAEATAHKEVRITAASRS